MIPNYGIRGGSLLLVVVLGLSACGHSAVGGARIDPALARYVPSDALAVAQVDLRRLRSTLFFQRHQSQLAALGSGSDAQQLLAAWDGKNAILAQTVSGANDVKLLGDPTLVAKMRSGGGNLPNELEPALASVPSSAQLWALLQGLPIDQLKLPSEYASLLANFHGHIRRTSVGIEAQSGLNLHARIECFSEQGSQRVDVALRAGIGLARLTSLQKDPLQARAYEALNVRRDGSSVYVEGSFPPDLSDYLLRHLLTAWTP